MAYDAYIRVSRVGGREGDSFISPDVQRDQIQAWARMRGHTIAQEHVDLDQSGAKLDRPAFNEAIRRAEQGLTEGIVVAKVDRFARSLPGALEAIRRLEQAGAEFVSVQDGIDPLTPTGKLMQRLLLSLAEFELDRIRDQWHDAMRRAVGRGVHFRVPLGYQKSNGGQLEVGPEAAAVRAMFTLRAEGKGWAEIADHLNERHPREIDWLPSVLPRLVRNRAYLGEAFHGEHRTFDAHPALVSLETWEAAQSPRAVYVKGEGTLLAGIIRCAGCRYPMKGDHGGRATPVYRCAVRHAGGRCKAPASVSRHLIEPHVISEFIARYGTISLQGTEATTGLQDAQRRIVEATAELDAYAQDTRLRDALGHERYVQAVEARAAELEEAHRALGEAQRDALAIIVPDEAIWDTLDTQDRRRLLSEGIDVVFLRRTGIAPISDRALILWRGEGPDDLPGRGVTPIKPRPFDW